MLDLLRGPATTVALPWAAHGARASSHRVRASPRAVNVGGAKVDMAELRSSLSGLALAHVQTYVQSGNVVFEAGGEDPRPHAAAIEGLVRRVFGLETKVLVLTAGQTAEVAAANPFLAAGADDESLHVTFLFDAVSDDAFRALTLPARDGEEATLAGRVVYLHLPFGYGRTKLSNAYFERALRTLATTRNWRTVTALAELISRGS